MLTILFLGKTPLVLSFYQSLVHNVFLMVTNTEWIPERSIHNGNKYPTDLETYFQEKKTLCSITINH